MFIKSMYVAGSVAIHPDSTAGQDWWRADSVDGWPRRGGRKERRKVWRLALPDGWRRGEGEGCVNWQQTNRWKVQGGHWVRCAGLGKENIMGCRLMVTVVCATGLPWSNDNLRFLKCSSKPQRGLRNGRHLARAGLFHHKQGPRTLTLEEGNVSKPYTTQFTLALFWKPRLLYA